jgi:WD40 repeat protein
MNEGPDKLKVHGVSRLSSCGSISCLSFACRRRDLLACGHGSGAVTLFQPDQNRALGKIDAHAGKVTDVGWSAHGNFLVTASEDKTCRVWVVASGVLEGKAGGEGEEVLSLTR